MTSYQSLAIWLKGSEWVDVLQEAELSTPGIAESFLKASHVTQTRHAHQVTACTLYVLLKNAYDVYVATNVEDPPESFSMQCTRRMTESPQFLYWYTNLELELPALAFVCSLRTGDFDLYKDTLTKWFFSLNHTHYARCMSFHMKDMCSLDSTHPDVAREFRHDKFVMAKSQRKFSLIAIDHDHEQNNGVIKDLRGVIGLTQDANALL